MPGVAFTMYLAFSAVALGWRSWLQHRRTGDHGFRGFTGRTGSIEWFGAFFLVAGAALAGAAPIAEILDLVEPSGAMHKPWLNRMGLAIALLGAAVTIVAQLQMRDSWRVGVDGKESTVLVAVGLFGIVRNPIYSGVLLATAGLVLMAPNVLSAGAFGLLLLGLQIQVRRVEEPYLIRVHGEAYRAYARTVGRFLPRGGRQSRLSPALAALIASSALLVPSGTLDAKQRIWSITVLGKPEDPRSSAVTEAVNHWNQQLASLGSGLRFGTVTWSEQRLQEEVLLALSEGVRARRRIDRPPGLEGIEGDVVIAFSGTDLISVGITPKRFGRAVVVLRRGDIPPLSLPNVARNIVTHELGHVLGLNHNGEPGTLMCGSPAPCLPRLFRSDTTVFFPLTNAERRALAKEWR